jgi:hypothetical protein
MILIRGILIGPEELWVGGNITVWAGIIEAHS